MLIRPGAIGDCILCLPAMEFLKADYTEAWLPSVAVPLIQFADKTESIASTGIDTLGLDGLPARSGVLDRILAFDEIVSWYGANRSEFQIAMQSSGVNCVFHAALPPADGDLHATDFFAFQVGLAPGKFPQLQWEPDKPRGTVVMHPFSGSAGKNWPLANYRQLAEELPLNVEWLAGPEDRLDSAVRVEDLATLAKWLTGASAYIGNDSGITHLAAAVGIPTIALFGPTNPRVWCPRGPNVRYLRHEPLSQLSVQAVRELVVT